MLKLIKYSTMQLIYSIVVIVLLYMTLVNSHHVRNRLSIYYESKCPDSRNFMLNQLIPLYNKFDQYVDLELVPFGNANVSYPKFDNKPYFQCQHGPDECYGNKAHACVLELTRNTRTPLNYIKCMFESDDWKNTRVSAVKCASKLGLNWDNLRDCIDGSHGDKLLVAHSHKTFNLYPPHKRIPWIVIDGKHTEEMQRVGEKHLLRYICENYHNTHEPKLEQCSEANLAHQKSESCNNVASLYNILVLCTIMVFQRL